MIKLTFKSKLKEVILVESYPFKDKLVFVWYCFDFTEVTKWSIRKKVWDSMEDHSLVNFPRPCHHRIPNFKVMFTVYSKLQGNVYCLVQTCLNLKWITTREKSIIFLFCWLQYVLKCGWLQYILKCGWLQYVLKCGWLQYILKCGWLQYVLKCGWLQYVLKCGWLQYILKCGWLQYTEVWLITVYTEVWLITIYTEVWLITIYTEVRLIIICSDGQGYLCKCHMFGIL